MKKVSVIVVNYNTKDILRDCVNNLLNDNYENLEIIVKDNGSTDGSYNMAHSEFKDKIILLEGENVGIAKANNLALKHATGDFIFHLGTDAFPKKHDISGMVSFMEQNPKVGISTAKLVKKDGELDMDAHRGFPTPWAALTHFSKLNRIFPKSKIFNQYFMGWENLNKPHEIDACISHCMLVKRDVYKGGVKWDEDYFVFGEDIDFCYVVKEAGWKIMYLPQFEVLHYAGAGVNRKSRKGAKVKTASSTSKTTQNRMKNASINAMKLFYSKHFAQKYPKFVTQLVMLGISILKRLR